MARNSNGSLEGRRLEASEGFLDRPEIRKDAVQGGQLENHPYLLVGSGKPELALGASDLLERRDDRELPTTAT